MEQDSGGGYARVGRAETAAALAGVSTTCSAALRVRVRLAWAAVRSAKTCQDARNVSRPADRDEKRGSTDGDDTRASREMVGVRSTRASRQPLPIIMKAALEARAPRRGATGARAAVDQALSLKLVGSKPGLSSFLTGAKPSVLTEILTTPDGADRGCQETIRLFRATVLMISKFLTD